MKNLKIVLFVCSIFFTNTHLVGQNITIKFSGRDAATSAYVSTDSIYIQNITQGADTLLTGQDTSLVLFLNTGIHDYETKNNGFELLQNYPNPFIDNTSFAIRVFTKGQYIINLTNLVGQQLTYWKGQLVEGTHLFTLTCNKEQFYILTVSSTIGSKSIKLNIHKSNGNSQPIIEYKQFHPGMNNDNALKVGNTSHGFPFLPGDMLKYVGYANGYKSYGLLDSPSESKNYIFNFDKQPSFKCGSSFTINHLAGSVAPVTKTVTYGTVTNIPGEPSKCWITQNLGADHQASAVNDATEASAGWYWQFNRKQGYKYDGTTRTPNTTWITNISENSDWLPANDPCALELGSGWRIPTNTEWSNVDARGNWYDWNGPWNSGLKLHYAGYIYDIDGLLYTRGQYAFYWSSLQNSNEDGRNIHFALSNCYIDNSNKARGFTNRCIKEGTTSDFSIGQNYGGGIIFYIDGTGQHGLIAASSDQSTGAQWGCLGTSISGTDFYTGTGQANTNAIVNSCNQTGIAARICNDLVLNGYDDWFLPSSNELDLMLQQKSIIGNFLDTIYWSSSQSSGTIGSLNNAIGIDFYTGSLNQPGKDNLYLVRAVRAF